MSRLNRSGSFEIVGETSEEYHAGLNKTGSSKSSINWNDMFKTTAGVLTSFLQPGGSVPTTTKLPAWLLPTIIGGVGVLAITMVATKKKK